MPPLILGIDIAKASFDVHLLDHHDPKSSRSLPNTPDGFRALADLVAGLPQDGGVALGVEPTSIYHLELIEWAHAQGFTVYLLNSAWLASFRRSGGLGHKTDSLDAWGLGELVRQRLHLLTPWQPEGPLWAKMRRLQRRRHDLVEHFTRESNRLEATLASEPELRRSLTDSLQFLEQQRLQVEADLTELLGQCAPAKSQVEALETIPGLGPVSARTLTLELGDLSQYPGAKSLTAKVGLVPYEFSSGQSRPRPRLRRGGNAEVKRVLFMAACSALQTKAWQPWLKAQRARKRGKKLIVAVMDKLLRLAYGVIKGGQEFDPELAFSC